MIKKTIDVTLSLYVGLLMIFGLIMISSVSVYSSYIMTSNLVAQWKLLEPSNSYFLVKTIANVAVGIGMLVVFSKIPYVFFEKYVKYIYFWCVLLLILVLFVGSSINGAKWWLTFPGIPTIQPVEFAKLGLIMMIAHFMKKRRSVIGNLQMWLLPFIWYVAMIIVPLMLQPDFWSILILVPVMTAMYFIGGWNIRIVWIACLIAFIGATTVYGIGKTSFGENVKIGYISKRIDNYLRSSTEIAASREADQKDYQLKQGFIALGSGGFTGLGFGNSIQKFWYLPEVQWDFIFSVIVEEIGFIGWVMLISIFMYIGYRGYNIARSVKDLFAKYTAFGITTWILVQAFINIWVNLSIIPLTWVTLPFVSYWGSSIMSLTMAVGILLSISRHAEYKPQKLSEALQARRKVIL